MSTAIVSWRSRFSRASMTNGSPCLAPYTRRTLVVSAPLLLCSVLSCLSSAASFHLRLLSIPVLLSFAATCSRHFASTTLIESSLHARVITPPLLSPERSFFLWFCSGEFFLVNRDRQLAIPLFSREHDQWLAMSRSVHSSYACRFCSLALMFRLELSVLRCFFSFASSFHPCPPLFRCYVLAPLRLHYTH